MQIPVLTSKPAQKDFQNIKSQHADILKSMALHAEKTTAYKQNKEAQFAQQNAMQMEMDKEKMTADTQAKKDAMTFAQKQSEIDIKRAALSAV
jgi:hypothetical protein